MSDAESIVAPSSTKPAQARHRRRWFQFSLRTLTIFMVACSLLLGAFGWRLQRARKQAEAVATIRGHGGSVIYDYGMRKGEHGMYEMTAATPAVPPHIPAALLNLLGEDFFCEVYAVYNAEPAPATQRELEANWNAIGDFAHLKILGTSARGWKRRGTSLSPGIKNLAKTPELQHLLIDQGSVDSLDLQVIGELRHLQELKLWGIEFDDAALESLVNLQELRVLEVNASKVAMKGTAAISKLRNLEELQLQFCSVGDDEAALLGELSNLRRLTVAESRIGDRGLKSIAKLQNLEWLDLPGAPVGDRGMESLGKLPKLSYVNLIRTKITNEGLRKLAKAKSITFLGLDQTPIDDDGLAALEDFPKLTDFYINWNPITDRGLAQARFPPTLLRLGLMNSKVTDDGMKHLAHLSALQSVDVQLSDVTSVGAAELTKSLPACRVMFAPAPKPKQAGP